MAAVGTESLRLARQLLVSLAKEEPRLLPLAAKIVRALKPTSHGPDFASVLWHGTNYYFTASQSKVVELLWQARKRRSPALRQEYILETIGSDCSRLCDLFKEHPAWNVMIVAGPVRGTFQLKADAPADADDD